MYLEHFGLAEPPFRITPVTVFFFSGANRGEILDALIYSICEVEGIIKVSGEVGSGKTMLCRMLLEKLPEHIETIYLANPSLSREEMLYAIADGLGLNIEGERVGIIMQNIQNKLEEKAREGKRIVVLVDEAHAMPPDTLEELRLLYNLQVGNFKLLQIVLFGQPELNAKLDQPNMRQLKDRIAHHFHMQPLSRSILKNYLMFRMRAAGYHGPNIFSPSAIKLIADASNGLMRRVNILADKSLLAAFVEDTHDIEARHVQAAMRDSELNTAPTLSDKKLLMGSAAAALLLFGLAAWWMLDKPQTSLRQTQDKLSNQHKPPTLAAAPAGPVPETQSIAAQPNNALAPASIAVANQTTVSPADIPNPTPKSVLSQVPTVGNVAVTTPPLVPVASSNPTTKKPSLFEQRLAAGKHLLEQKTAVASIQLFYNEEVKPERIEGFLKRANALGKLPEIYLLPAKFGGKNGLRVLYGAYPSIDAAHNAVKDLPARYQEAFATSTYIF
jgi:type II secretory pathway predicted ATPase ExeA/septal ring-binding cell division protein DamX